ncbi:MAG: helix-turn-helix domain-containing protein [Planctomycetota bacterium]
MLRTPLDQIEEETIRHFVAKTKLPETASLDYKRDYDLRDSKGKKGLLADICAFANNGGGHILVGVDEQRDATGAKTGMPVDQPSGARWFDQSVAENLIHASIEPRIGNFVRIQAVQGSWADGPVYVIKVDRTWNPPHSVTSSERRTFYRRSGANSEPMDMNQIRDAFSAAATLADRARAFHRERVQLVLSGKTTFPLVQERGRSIVHVLPLSFFASGERLPLDNVPLLCPSSGAGGSWSPVPNFDGRIAYAGRPEATSYLQVFRHGAVEGVNTDLTYEERDRLGFRVRQVELDVLTTVEQAQKFFDSQPDLGPPCLVMLSVVGIEGTFIPPPNPGYDTSHIHTIELDHLGVLDVQLDDLAGEVEQVLRPTFDVLWQSSGWPKSLSFDDSGRFTTPRQ